NGSRLRHRAFTRATGLFRLRLLLRLPAPVARRFQLRQRDRPTDVVARGRSSDAARSASPLEGPDLPEGCLAHERQCLAATGRVAAKPLTHVGDPAALVAPHTHLALRAAEVSCGALVGRMVARAAHP